MLYPYILEDLSSGVTFERFGNVRAFEAARLGEDIGPPSESGMMCSSVSLTSGSVAPQSMQTLTRLILVVGGNCSMDCAWRSNDPV
jgi:hypothetical protein